MPARPAVGINRRKAEQNTSRPVSLGLPIGPRLALLLWHEPQEYHEGRPVLRAEWRLPYQEITRTEESAGPRGFVITFRMSRLLQYVMLQQSAIMREWRRLGLDHRQAWIVRELKTAGLLTPRS